MHSINDYDDAYDDARDHDHDDPASYDNARGDDHDPAACHYEHPATRDDNCGACHFSCIHSAAERPKYDDPFASFLRGVARDCIDGPA